MLGLPPIELIIPSHKYTDIILTLHPTPSMVSSVKQHLEDAVIRYFDHPDQYQSISSDLSRALQRLYDKEVLSLNLKSLPVPESPESHSAYRIYATYTRQVKIAGTKISFSMRIRRLRPLEGGSTHALLPFYMTGWMTYLLFDLMKLIKALKTKSVPEVSIEFNVCPQFLYRIRNLYEHRWKNSEVDLEDKPESFVRKCFRSFHTNFLQPARTFYGNLVRNAILAC